MYRIQAEDGLIILKDHLLDIKRIYGKLNDNNFYLEGHLSNIDQLIFKSKAEGSIEAGFDFIDLGGIKSVERSDKASSRLMDLLLSNLSLKINLSTRKLTGKFGELSNTNLQGQWEKDTFHIQSFHSDYHGLKIYSTGLLSFRNNWPDSLFAVVGISSVKTDIKDFITNYSAGPASDKVNQRSLPYIKIVANLAIDTLLYNQIAFNNISGKANITNELITISTLSANLAKGRLGLDVKLANWADNDRRLSGQINLSFDTLDVKSFLNSLTEPDHSTEIPGKAESPVERNNNIKKDLNFVIDAQKIKYDQIMADSIRIDGEITDHRTEVKHFSFNYAGGQLSAEGIIRSNNDNTITGNVISNASGVDIKVFLNSFGNFGQSFVTEDKIAGRISWNADLYFKLDNTYKPITDDNLWIFNFEVTDAQLSNFVPVEKSLSFIRQKSKENILISHLNFSTCFTGQKLYFQDVNIQNSISDMNIFGIYSPKDTLVDLNLKISLSDLLFKTLKRRMIETEDGLYDVGENHDLNLKFYGTIGSHQVKPVVHKEYLKLRKTMQDQFDKFDLELKKRISEL
jgi:hypothetical protein